MSQGDEIIKKTKTWVKVIGIISGGILTIMTPLIVMYVEVKPKVDKAQDSAEDGYEAIVPAIVEIQTILDEATDWAEGIDIDFDEMQARQDEVEDRLIRCEEYMEMVSNLSNHRNLPPIEPRHTLSGTEDPVLSSSVDDPPAPPVQKKAMYEMPKDLEGAKAKVDSRDAAKCAPSDPLCGAL